MLQQDRSGQAASLMVGVVCLVEKEDVPSINQIPCIREQVGVEDADGPAGYYNVSC